MVFTKNAAGHVVKGSWLTGKDCNLHIRSFWNVAKTQKVLKEMRDLEKDELNTVKDVVKEFTRERAKAANAAGKGRFNISAYRKSLVAKSGDRNEKQREMMWEGQYLEIAKTAAFGFLTKEEAETQWRQNARGSNGPKR